MGAQTGLRDRHILHHDLEVWPWIVHHARLARLWDVELRLSVRDFCLYVSIGIRVRAIRLSFHGLDFLHWTSFYRSLHSRYCVSSRRDGVNLAVWRHLPARIAAQKCKSREPKADVKVKVNDETKTKVQDLLSRKPEEHNVESSSCK